MKRLASFLSILLIGIILSTLFYPPLTANAAEDSATPIIANHNNATLADLEAIPAKWINKAKTDLCIVYGHTSHGSQIVDGMSGLAGFKGNVYAWNGSGINGALELRNTPDGFGTDLGNSKWPDITRNYLKNNSGINVVMWSWCGQVSSASETSISNYLSAMTKLEKDFPKIKFVYMTGHTDGSGTYGNLHKRNEQIRQYCRTNNKILFDFADIESYDPNGDFYMNMAVNDNCDYDSDGNGSRDKNWATAWQNSHTKNIDWYDCGSAHSQPLNANMKAYAAWHLWARLAGWDGGNGSDEEDDGPKTFNDISNAYAKAEIEALASVGYFDWIQGKTFNPNRNITREEFLHLLVTSLNLDADTDSNFSDVKSTDFYCKSAGIARKLGISKGIGNNKLGVGMNITRQDMSTMIVRAFKAAGKQYSSGSADDLEQFSDKTDIADYAQDSMAMLVKSGFLVGYNKLIDPKGTFTMQQAAMVIWRIYNN